MIRNAVIHLLSEQPLLADLYELPTASDVGLRCTNLRMLDGKRPVFVDRSEAVFYFPYLHVRFIEIPPTAVATTPEPSDAELAAVPASAPTADDRADDLDLEIEIDEDFLRRVREA